MPAKSDRWVGEMEEIAATFGSLGLPPQMHQGAAALFEWIAVVKPKGDLGPGRGNWQTAGEIVAGLAERLPEGSTRSDVS
jgi:hypothetical protein